MKKFLSINELCTVTGLSQHYVRTLIKDSKLPHITSGCKVLINYELASSILDEMSLVNSEA